MAGQFKRLLVTGAAGKVARSVRQALAAHGDEMRLTDIVPFDECAHCTVCCAVDSSFFCELLFQ